MTFSRFVQLFRIYNSQGTAQEQFHFIFNPVALSLLGMSRSDWLQRFALGRVVKYARAHLGFSLRDLAKKSGVSPSHILRIESGEFDVQLSTLLRLAVYLGTPPGLLIEEGLRVPPRYYEKLLLAEDFAELIEPDSEPKRWQAKRRRAVELCSGVCVVLTELLLSADPESLVSRYDFPTESLRASFPAAAKEIREQMQFVDRLAVLNELEIEPVEQLHLLHLLDRASIEQYAALSSSKVYPMKLPWRPEPRPLFG